MTHANRDDTRRAVVAGPDENDIGAALTAEGVGVATVEGIPTGESLDDAGVDEAALYVLTDVTEATSIPVAKEQNPEVRAVVYADGSLPEFAQPITDLTVDPALLDPETVAEELAAHDGASERSGPEE